jgi:putative ABC transport system permease protein
VKFGGLIFANLFRKKIRLMLTIGSFAVALFLFGVLAAVYEVFDVGPDLAVSDRLIVINRASIIQTLPVSFKERIEHLPGVKQVTFHRWFAGIYQDEKNFFPQYAIEVENRRQVFPEFVVPDGQWQVFAKDRQGAIVGAATAKRFGWKLGDRIPIRGTIFPGSWEFNLDGIYHGRHTEDDQSEFWFQWDYLNERLALQQRGQVDGIDLRIENRDDSVRIGKLIDAEFANSLAQTRTYTDKAIGASFVKQMGNVELLILSIGGVVFFTLLLVTGNTMAFAVRERTSEIAVLKAVGYSELFVLLLVLAESLVLAVVGGGLGLALAKLFTLRGDPTGGILPFFHLSPKAIFTGLAVALVVGAASGLLPAIFAMRLRVVDALRRV